MIAKEFMTSRIASNTTIAPAAASCAALCGSKFDPHMPVLLSKIIPCLSVAKSDSTRAVIATLAARFSECAASSRWGQGAGAVVVMFVLWCGCSLLHCIGDACIGLLAAA